MSDTPLSGLRVLELGAFIAGPFAGQLLGDLGADVIKVEPPGAGDIMRRYGVRVGGRSLWWPAIARNKRSVAIDLRDERGRDLVRRCEPARGAGARVGVRPDRPARRGPRLRLDRRGDGRDPAHHR
jgi:crotonobetainyl-CoA:carnitine CoA-transferase CaiB-like acyl-CoA transferase